MSDAELSDIWKINFQKKLDEDEMAQFEMLRKVYKDRIKKELPKNQHISIKGK